MIPRTLRPYLEPGLVQLRRLWLPFVAIQLVGLAVVLGYFFVPAVRNACDALADAKARGGLPFVAITMSFACGLMPELFKFATGTDRRLDRERGSFTLHNIVLFAAIGILANAFYALLARWLGDGRAPAIVLAKTAVDQFVFSAMLSVPLIVGTFTLRKHGYRPGPASRELGGAWYLREVVPVLLVNWAYWWPMGLLMYTLPPKMTFVYGAIGAAASVTLLTAIAGASKRTFADAPLIAAAPD